MRKRRLTLLSALLLSLLLHVAMVGGGELTLPDFYTSPDEILARKRVTHVQRVQILAHPQPAKAPPSGMRMVSMSSSATHMADARPAKKKKPRQKSREDEAKPSPLPPEQAQAQAGQEAPAEASESAPPEPAPLQADQKKAARLEPAPAFPIQLTAQLEAHVNGLSATLNQSWIMEGYRYAISLDGRKFGFHLRLTSEGHISPEGGLSMEHSQMLLGGKVRSFTDYDNGTIRYGKPDNPHQDPLPVTPQDIASLPFHLAVTFNGQPQTVFVSTGRRVYQVRFSVDAEETLKLPVGTLRTLHLLGEQLDPRLGQMVHAYDVWLAPDYLNFPVKVTGHLNGGEPIEYRVKSLEIEGHLALGSQEERAIAGPDEAIPDWLRQRTEQENLKNP